MPTFRSTRLGVLSLLLVFFFSISPAEGQRNTTSSSAGYDESLYNALEWRNVGPFRGGRSATVTGVPGKPNLFYFGSTGGGVWRSKDGGQTWENISDGYFGGSIGAVAVSEYDNNVIYVGGGEKTVRGNVSYGYGMWRSVDAGKTWTHIGLDNSRHISRVRIHPRDPDLVYAAVMGDLYKSSDERGVYRSKDGGKNWERILFANADAGAVDLILDPNNPRILYASTWRIRRTPYSLESGGEGSALWKSTDGGDTWKNISGNKGLPEGIWGINGVTVSPANSERVWAIIENDNGGVFRSDDAGETWTKLNDDRNLRQRAWYYSRIYADSQDEDILYVLNVRYHKSTDGGRTFESNNAPHGDHHDLWIAPEDNQRMIIGDDGGAQTSFDGGENWSTYGNQPTAQFYRVITDNHFPYRIYGAQQDNSTVRIAHRTSGRSIGESDWESTAGGESAHLAIDPDNPEIVYGGSYGGFLTRVNHATEQAQAINVWPDNPMGYGAEGMKYRFQWNFPIFFSPHESSKLYALSNQVHVSYNGGQSWEIISPDLTRNDPEKLVSSGGPITKDNTGVEYYCTLFAGAESPYEKDLIWIGSDDGLIHISKDGGENWENVTPGRMPEWMMINSIDPDPFVKGGAYVAGTRYKLGDYEPYLYKTEDYGKTWKKIVNGIPADEFTRVVRADPKRKGLLYAGTEKAMYISFDDGANWQPFQLNLPTVPITDLTIKNDNLIAATQGRAFWMIDDLTPLHQLNETVAGSDFYLYQPMPSYRMDGGSGRPSKTEGQNHPGGVMVHYYLKEKPADTTAVKIAFYEMDGDLIKEFSTDAKERGNQIDELKAGGNRFVWDMRYPDAKDFKGMILWGGSMSGPEAVPGKYLVKLTVGDETLEQEFEILKDPRSESSIADLQEQFDFVQGINTKVSEAHQTIIDIRDARDQMKSLSERMKTQEDSKDILDKIKAIQKSLTEVEEELYQTKNRSRQDPLNYPIKLTNKLAAVKSLSDRGNFAPTEQAKQVRKEITEKIDDQLQIYREVINNDLPELNRMVQEKAVDAIMLQKPKVVN
ncbi:VPS10 domain-containing protein [Flavilitoribacter nigricans]|uniref:Glycosyl hydrolase n=1 Tax=Flavilitoribacter nigricans (strain ATCC 23147 / DSM 23189 / NBRC 102662 / NCIMB 1420 / SS-2) TaxID=1122177 RepID=A0A2D0MYB9_FLAN2|nr:glycosyl hydrolase [Flavilitoribacter nigricans]PHN01245.1 glycosyl hydrolase [Flavilitoribacter nigricans DSM 23189 = NBRC 102662]